VLSVREFISRDFQVQSKWRLMNEEIVEGIDELGALLMGDHGALWYGSQLSIEEARELLGRNTMRPRSRSRYRCWPAPSG
jgi:Homospermidine synthase